MPSLEKEDLCQPNTKINVLEEPGGGALLDVCAPGKNVGRLGSTSLLYRLRLQPLLQLRREVCLRPSERGSVMLCSSPTTTFPQRHIQEQSGDPLTR